MLTTLSLTIWCSLAAVAVRVSTRVMKAGTGFPSNLHEESNYLDVPRGIVTGILWASVIWTGVFTLMVSS
jgi:hypothetical protein